MPRDSRYDILFQPMKIGPKTARNRFYQVPHCNGMGYAHPHALAAMRGVKAEGGWAVVSTEEAEIHPSSEFSPFKEGRLWDDADIPANRLVTDAIHKHGSLAAIELAFNGMHSANRTSRLPPLAPSNAVSDNIEPVQARGMDLADIRNLRRWHRDAAIRARRAGYDIVYVYAGHAYSMLHHWLSPALNRRTDAYGGSVKNRVRLIRELIEDAKDAVGTDTAVVFRLAVDDDGWPEPLVSRDDIGEAVTLLAELPDLWDVNVSGWARDSSTARFEPNEGYQDDAIAFVKGLTTKPVVGVGRYTSADGMAARIAKGLVDFIGAARPSIADPFLPNKIAEGRIDDIRECIGCNVCVAADSLMAPLRCTQNPTMGEEWRRGWHPERVTVVTERKHCLVVGAGPAGLECALQLGRRGHEVTLAEASHELGGRVTRESRLPGLASYGRVRDYRAGQLSTMANVEIFRDSRMLADDVRGFGAEAVFIATGSHWRTDGVGRTLRSGIDQIAKLKALSPEAVMAGNYPSPDRGSIALYDDDSYYLGSVLAEKLVADGFKVHFISPLADVAHWTGHTLEQGRIEARLMALGVNILTGHVPGTSPSGEVEGRCVHTGRRTPLETSLIVPVTSRDPDDALYLELAADEPGAAGAGISTLKLIGDAYAPAIIAAAVWSGHRAAMELDADPAEIEAAMFRRDMLAV